jgi:hypothetical protein
MARLAAICLSLAIELLIRLVEFLRSWQTVSHSAALHTETVRSPYPIIGGTLHFAINRAAG